MIVEEYLIQLQEAHPLHRRRAMEKRIIVLTAKMNKKCPTASDPNLCKQKYQQKIQNLKVYVNKLRHLKFSTVARGQDYEL